MALGTQNFCDFAHIKRAVALRHNHLFVEGRTSLVFAYAKQIQSFGVFAPQVCQLDLVEHQPCITTKEVLVLLKSAIALARAGQQSQRVTIVDLVVAQCLLVFHLFVVETQNLGSRAQISLSLQLQLQLVYFAVIAVHGHDAENATIEAHIYVRVASTAHVWAAIRVDGNASVHFVQLVNGLDGEVAMVFTVYTAEMAHLN